MRQFFSFGMLIIASSLLNGSTINYSTINSIEQLIEYETLQILNTNPSEIKLLCEAYIDRAESFLFSHKYEDSLEDFQKAYDLSDNEFKNNLDRTYLKFRSLFGMLIIYSNLEKNEEATHAYNHLEMLIDSMQCEHCHDKVSGVNYNSHFFTNITCRKRDKTDDVETDFQENTYTILGPNENIPGWCEEVVNGTAISLEALALFATTVQARVALLGLIDALKTRCLKCCATGEFWKICVAPIVNKWKQLNDKYQLFGIPPDPAWD